MQQCFSIGGVILFWLGSYCVVSSGHWNFRPGAEMGRTSSQVAAYTAATVDDKEGVESIHSVKQGGVKHLCTMAYPWHGEK